MADPIGEFALNHIGNVYAKNDAGVVVAHANYEGAATGFGTVMGTMSSPLPVSGATSGAPLSDEVLTFHLAIVGRRNFRRQLYTTAMEAQPGCVMLFTQWV